MKFALKAKRLQRDSLFLWYMTTLLFTYDRVCKLHSYMTCKKLCTVKCRVRYTEYYQELYNKKDYIPSLLIKCSPSPAGTMRSSLSPYLILITICLKVKFSYRSSLCFLSLLLMSNFYAAQFLLSWAQSLEYILDMFLSIWRLISVSKFAPFFFPLS